MSAASKSSAPDAALGEAILRGGEEVGLLLSQGADPNGPLVPPEKWVAERPLHIAAERNAAVAVAALLAAGGDVSLTNRHGDLPIHSAARGRGAAAIRLLVAAGADPNERFCSPLLSYPHSLTPLMLALGSAILEGHTPDRVREAVETLLACGAAPAARSLYGMTAYNFACERGSGYEGIAALLGRADGLGADRPRMAYVKITSEEYQGFYGSWDNLIGEVGDFTRERGLPHISWQTKHEGFCGLTPEEYKTLESYLTGPAGALSRHLPRKNRKPRRVEIALSRTRLWRLTGDPEPAPGETHI